MTCRCGLALFRHLGHEACKGCLRTPAFCRCAPVDARVPAWIQRQREGRLPAKELVA